MGNAVQMMVGVPGCHFGSGGVLVCNQDAVSSVLLVRIEWIDPSKGRQSLGIRPAATRNRDSMDTWFAVPGSKFGSLSNVSR